MKLLRYGPVGQEKPGLLDRNGQIRDLSGAVRDIDGESLSPASLDRLRRLDPATLPLVAGTPRLGPCVGNVPKIVAIGRKSVEYYRRREAEVEQSYTQIPTDVAFAQIKSMTRPLVEMFASGEVDEVHLVFTRYVNAITFRPGHVQFLPIVPEKRAKRPEGLYEFEPQPTEILDALIPRYVEVTFHRLLLESMSSEHAARMNAMQNATENASDLIQSLTLQYNKSRQAGITKELLDIVGGAEALRG